MEDSQISKEKTNLTWDDMVGEFIEYCRALGRLVERGKKPDEIVKVLKNITERAKEFDQIKEDNSGNLFGSSNNLFDAQNKYCANSNQNNSNCSQLICEIGLREDSAVGNIDVFLKKRKKYLKIFFGLDYKENWLPEQEFQIQQLLLILYKCSLKGKRGILGNIGKASFWRFRNEEDNPYKDYLFFIQKELLKGINFADALNIVYAIESFRVCLNNTIKVIIDSVLNDLITPSSEDVISIQNDLYTMILVYLREINTKEQTKIQEFENLFVFAFYNFRLLEIMDSIKEPRLVMSLDYINDRRVKSLEHLKKRLGLNALLQAKYSNMQKESEDLSNTICVNFVNRLEPIDDFIGKNKEYIAESLGHEIYPITIQRHCKDYIKLVKLFKIYNAVNDSYVVTANELLWIIFLYEECQVHEKPLGCVSSIVYRMKKIGKIGEFHRVALREGYNGSKKNRRNKRFLETVRDLREVDISHDSMLRDKVSELYEIICFLNTLNSLIAQESDSLVNKKFEIKRLLYMYLKRVATLEGAESGKCLDITQIVESIMGRDKLRQYCKWKEAKMQKKLFKCLHP